MKLKWSRTGIQTVVLIGGIMAGTESVSLVGLLYSRQFQLLYGQMNRWEHTVLASSTSIGAVFGWIACSFLYERLGARKLCIGAGLLWTIASVVIFLVSHLAAVVASKVLKGIGLGLVELVVTMCVSEILPPTTRGSAVAVFHVGSAVGATLMMAAGFWVLSAFRNPSLVRYICIVDCIPALVFVVAAVLFPQSPRWLALKNRWLEAAANMEAIGRLNGTTITTTAKQEDVSRIAVIRAYTSGPVIRQSTYGKLFGRRFRKQTLMSIFVMLASQTTCIHVFMYFFKTICDICLVGENGAGAQWLGIFHYLAMVLFSVVLAAAINKCRRKDSLVFGFILVGCALISLGVLICIYGKRVPRKLVFEVQVFGLASSAILALFLLFISIQAVAITAVSWTYVCELFPGYARTKGIAIAMVAYWISDAILRLCVPLTIKVFKQYVFIVAGSVTLVSGLIITRFPETRNLSDIEIEALYDPNRGDIETHLPAQPMDIELSNLEKPKMFQLRSYRGENRNNQNIMNDNHLIYPNDDDSGGKNGNDNNGNDNDNGNHHYQDEQHKYNNTPVLDKLSIFTSTGSSSSLSAAAGVVAKPGVLLYPEEVHKGLNLHVKVFSPATGEESYFSQDWAGNEAETQPVQSTNMSEPVLLNDGLQLPTSSQESSFHHRNMEGSPLKAGITYEPTTFLRHDALHVAQKDQYDTCKQRGRPVSKYGL